MGFELVVKGKSSPIEKIVNTLRANGQLNNTYSKPIPTS
jgi:hypothetical protein